MISQNNQSSTKCPLTDAQKALWKAEIRAQKASEYFPNLKPLKTHSIKKISEPEVVFELAAMSFVELAFAFFPFLLIGFVMKSIIIPAIYLLFIIYNAPNS